MVFYKILETYDNGIPYFFNKKAFSGICFLLLLKIKTCVARLVEKFSV